METYNWGLYQEISSTKFVKKDWYVLCWSAKWLGSKKVLNSSLIEFKKNKEKQVMQKLWDLLDEADIVHNGVKFDRKKCNARFLIHGFPPPSPYKMVDTLTVARGEFAFTSNRLNDLGQYLQVGKKVDTGGFELWLGCMADDKKCWKKMVKYCDQDVRLLEKVYLKLRPYMRNHPNLGTYFDQEKPMCPKCGCENIIWRGFVYTVTKKKKRFSCKSCGGWSTERKGVNRNVKVVNA
jgi:DNA polymerase III epsilon subunit-like protein